MAYFEYSPASRESMLNLNRNEVKQLLPSFRKSAKHYADLAEKWQDIIEGPEATSRQQTLAMKYQNLADWYDGLVAVCETFLSKRYH